MRYYVEQGLIIPDTRRSHMEFTEREYEDLQYIQRLRRAEFNIREIYDLLALRRVTNMMEKNALEDYCALLAQKRQALNERIQRLQEAVRQIDGDIAETRGRADLPSRKLGVPLCALSKMVCPCCNSPLELKNARLSNRYVYAGKLSCSCGYHIAIRNGVVVTGNCYTGCYDHPDLSFGGCYEGVGEHFVTNFQKSCDYIMAQLSGQPLSGKVVLEANINGYFFPLYAFSAAAERLFVYSSGQI